MRCYYPYVNFIPTAIPREDQLGNFKRCTYTDLSLPQNELQDFKNSPEMRNKGNVLQYKINQNPLSKNMIYSRKVRGEWTNNKKTYATQTQKVANPNTGSLLRVGGTLTSVGGDPTSTNTYCIYNPETFPSNQPSEVVVIPPYAYTEPPVDIITPPEELGPITADPYDPPPVSEEEPVNYVAPTGGVLICSLTVVPTCNTSVEGQQVINQTFDQMCYSAENSDVPGSSLLCWDEGQQTWYPRSFPGVTT